MGLKKFKAGDKVRFLKYGRIGWESVDWSTETEPPIEVGEIYTVKLCLPRSITLVEDLNGLAIHNNHFEKVEIIETDLYFQKLKL